MRVNSPCPNGQAGRDASGQADLEGSKKIKIYLICDMRRRILNSKRRIMNDEQEHQKNLEQLKRETNTWK